MMPTSKRQKRLTDFFKGESEKYKGTWSAEKSVLLYQSQSFPPYLDKIKSLGAPLKIAGFDLDETIITTLSNRRFAKDQDDWKFLIPDVPEFLEKLCTEDFIIAIFTNQLGVGLDQSLKLETQFRTKVESIASRLNLPIIFLAALQEDFYRKPCYGMWDLFEQRFVHPGIFDAEKSFFVGDAAGRKEGWKLGRPADHADTDLKFALNVNITFRTPEEFFLKEATSFTFGGFDPSEYLERCLVVGIQSYITKLPKEKHVIVFVGSPASGKSTFYHRHMADLNYCYINQDSLKTKSKCMKTYGEALRSGQNVVIDNTNPSKESRKEIIDAALSNGVSLIIGVWFKVDKFLSRHLNVFRSVTQQKIRLPGVAFNSFENRFMPPSAEEGFTHIFEVPFIPIFDSDNDRRIFSKHLI